MKENAITAQIVSDLNAAGTVRLFRGCLKLPAGATIGDHERAIKQLVRACRNRRHRHPQVMELDAVAHVTAVNQQHYDITVVADAGLAVEEVREFIRGSWTRAGGVFGSLVERDVSDWARELRYQYKTRNTEAVTQMGRRLEPHDAGLIPARNGLKARWGSVAFSRGRDAVWKRVLEGWFGAGSNPNQIWANSSQPDPDQQDRRIVESLLPTDPDRALPLSVVAYRAGMNVDRTLAVIRTLPRVYRHDGYRDRVNLFWKRKPGGAAVAGSVLACDSAGSPDARTGTAQPRRQESAQVG